MTDKVQPHIEHANLRSDYKHASVDSLLTALVKFFGIYANRDNWRRSRGSPPHHLREGMRLDFHPSNVVDGFAFADEAIEAIEKFRREAPEREQAASDKVQAALDALGHSWRWERRFHGWRRCLWFTLHADFQYWFFGVVVFGYEVSLGWRMDPLPEYFTNAGSQ